MSRETPLPIGTRVVAVSHNDGKELFVFGRGVFEGYFLPPSIDVTTEVAEIQKQYAIQRTVTPDLPEEFPAEHARVALILAESNPRIKLDNGETVWGYECWWSDVETFEKKAVGYTLVDRDINVAREENKKLEQMEAEFRSAILGAAAQTGTTDVV
jgi:hypothetical protein